MHEPYWMQFARLGLIRLNDEGGDGGGDGAPVDAETDSEDAPIEGEEALGDPGKRALDAMKAAKRAAEKEAREARNELAALKAAAEGREAEWKAEQEAQRIKDEALAAANQRILKAEIRALAAGKLADPSDALLYLDTSDFDVDDEGNFDPDAITSAIDALISSKPYLAVQDGSRFNGSADAGVRKGSGVAQLGKADLARMTPQQIDEARKKGQLDDLLGRKP